MREVDALSWGVSAEPLDELGDLLGHAQRLVAAAPDGAMIALARREAVAGPRHLAQALHLAHRAWRRGEATARTLDAELLLCLCGERQVREALAKAGAAEGRRWVALAFVEDDPEAEQELLTALFGAAGATCRHDTPRPETVLKEFRFHRPAWATMPEDASRALLERLALAAHARMG